MASNVNQARINFSRVTNPLPYSDFLEVQLKSFQNFLQLDTPREQRKEEGLHKVFAEIFPIEDTRNSFVLDFLDYFIDPPKYSIKECLERGQTYSVPLKIKLKLSCTDPENEGFNTVVQDVYLGNIPYMTESGTFVINGAERVIVSQLHRSPGVFFSSTVTSTRAVVYSARIIPFKGSWIEITTDATGKILAYIDRKKKVPVTTLLRAMGYDSNKDILDLFSLAEEVAPTAEALRPYIGRKLAAPISQEITQEFPDEDTGEISIVTRTIPMVDMDTELTEELIEKITTEYLPSGSILVYKDESITQPYGLLMATLKADTNLTEELALRSIYNVMRGGSDAPDESAARELVNNLFFSSKRYDLGDVGRYRINRKLNLDIDPDVHTLTNEDFVAIIKYIIEMHNSKAQLDDIDHLSNRRIRTVGEQLYNQFSVGMTRMARTVRDRMNVRDNETFTPSDIMNSKTFASVVNSFFGTNALSQFMDQTNPLAEITHKRRISALGPGGISRDRAGFEVRDVHYTHYGRLCPIETPEGPNIGLISSLCVYAKINDLGFITTPYRKVTDGQVEFSDEGLRYYTAEDEEDKTVAQGNALLDKDGRFVSDRIKARFEADFPVVTRDQVDLMDVSPTQIASIAASLIPFLEHDDANRALMGSNMMRQAVPLLRPEAPIVGTGVEAQLVRDSRSQVVAERSGEVIYVDANFIKIKYDYTEDELFVRFEDEVTTYELPKFRRTNQSTTIDLRPICRKGQRVEAGDILTEGYSTQAGELALGRNVQVAYMPWKGYNYEDAIVLNERLVREDFFTSVHVDEYILEVRETKRGLEELTSDIPNVSDDATRNLDENGIIRIGARIEPGDIMIGKITPKGESDPTPEEKLLRAIFGDKAGDVKDASLKATPSLRGVVIDTKLYSRALKTKGRKEVAQIKEEIREKYDAMQLALRKKLVQKLRKLAGKKTCNKVEDHMGVALIPHGAAFTEQNLEALPFEEIRPGEWTSDEHTNELMNKLLGNYCIKTKQYEVERRRRELDETIGDDLPSGIVQLAKVYVAKKRKIQVGDKMAGRHGNKGIVSKVVRQEDMPFLEDGTPVDICLNPLGVPSRMNLGQIFEAVLAWSGRKLDCKFATPVFDGASLEDMDQWTDKAGLPRNGKTYLYDGGTGERFDQPATVGVTYFLKLGHMVDDKMHARSIGPYSLITQQPLGGKAQFGGQRFGEMEVWALEAFGAAHILQEILTVKSDDVQGRSKTYEAIVKNDPMPTPGIPESLNVLLHELKGLGLSFELK